MNTDAKELEAKTVDVLKRLVELKDYKDKYGKDEHYQKEQPYLWEIARKTLKACEGNPVADTGANAINTLLTAGAYLGSLVGKEVSVEPGFIYECRGFQLNENGSGTLYGKNGFCTFGSYKAVRPCR